MLNIVVMQATLQDDETRCIRKYPPMKCAERHEVALVITLKMRKFTPVECHESPKKHVETSASPVRPGRNSDRTFRVVRTSSSVREKTTKIGIERPNWEAIRHRTKS